MTWDPFASAYNHPELPAGFNSDDIDGDDFNGPGTNWPVWPLMFDSYEGLEPLVMNRERYEVFDGCADYGVPMENNLITLGNEGKLYMVGGSWPMLVPPPINRRIVMLPETREKTIADDSETVVILGITETITLSSEVHEQEIEP